MAKDSLVDECPSEGDIKTRQAILVKKRGEDLVEQIFSCMNNKVAN